MEGRCLQLMKYGGKVSTTVEIWGKSVSNWRNLGEKCLQLASFGEKCLHRVIFGVKASPTGEIWWKSVSIWLNLGEKCIQLMKL